MNPVVVLDAAKRGVGGNSAVKFTPDKNILTCFAKGA